MPPLRYKYQTITIGEHDIHLRTLMNRNQFHDPDGEAEAAGIYEGYWSLFGVVWNAARVLAELMNREDIEGKRILEMGCGIALPSLLLHKRGADITATDYHPEAGAFLADNVELNELPPLPWVQADWALESPELGQFDLLIGSDILYERDHVDVLAGFVERHAKPASRVVLVDAGRGHSNHFARALQAQGFELLSKERADDGDHLTEEFGGWVYELERHSQTRTG